MKDGGVSHFHGILIPITPSPERMCTVTGPFDALLNDFVRHRLEVVGPAYLGKHVDECGGHVEVVSEFGRFVVPWEDVMVVVPTFAECENSNRLVL